ncbi:MAG TPA: site-specific DNA-methyltransferase [Chroococcales cyanobacterium]|jgi:site-specific DNA-methyltransferase (adenine-specific)
MNETLLMFSEKVRLEKADCIDFLRSLPDAFADTAVSDPAYSGMNQHLQLGKGRIVGRYKELGEGKWFEEFADTPENYRNFLGELYRVLKQDSHLYLMFDSFSLLTLAPIVREFFSVKNLIVWDKVNIGMGHYFRRRHEHVLFAVKGKKKLNRKDLPDVWRIPRLHKSAYPTQKPVALFEAMLEGSCQEGDMVLDPFLGSGSSAIAALKKNCHFVGCDLSAKAISIAEQRTKDFLASGKDPLEK